MSPREFDHRKSLLSLADPVLLEVRKGKKSPADIIEIHGGDSLPTALLSNERSMERFF